MQKLPLPLFFDLHYNIPNLMEKLGKKDQWLLVTPENLLECKQYIIALGYEEDVDDGTWVHYADKLIVFTSDEAKVPLPRVTLGWATYMVRALHKDENDVWYLSMVSIVRGDFGRRCQDVEANALDDDWKNRYEHTGAQYRNWLKTKNIDYDSL